MYSCRKCGTRKYLKDYSIHIRQRGAADFTDGHQTCDSCRVGVDPRKSGLYFEEGALWRKDGACVGEDPDLWFPEKEQRGSPGAIKAAEICATCPVKALCATYAADQKLEGIWGGKYFSSPVEKRTPPPYDILSERAPRKGVDNMLTRGQCTKKLHSILSLDDVFVKGNGSMRCRKCWDAERPLRTKKMQERRARGREAARSQAALP